MKKILTLISLFLVLIGKTQTIDVSAYKPTPEAEKMYSPYIMAKKMINDVPTFEKWKESNKIQYFKELWYYSKSFTVIHHVNDEGITIDESIIDISRFDWVRDSVKEIYIPLTESGYNDTIVLLPINKLLYKPE